MGLDMRIQIAITDNDKNFTQFKGDPINLTPEQEIQMIAKFMKETLITIAKDVLEEEQGLGFDKNPVRAVDNIVGRKEQDVKPFGLIQYNAKVATSEFLLPLYEGLISRSARDTGMYVESHFVFFRGQLVAGNPQELKTWLGSNPDIREGAKIRFVNVMPYASKLERKGVTAGRQQSAKVKSKDKRKRSGSTVRRPNGAYFLTAKSTNRKFKNNSLIRFEWINGRSLNLSGVPTVGHRGNKLRTTFHPSSGRKGFYVYPSISITIQSGGIA